MIRVSQRLDYAIRSLVLLALRQSSGFVSGADIALALGLPQRVVEQQLSQLARAGLLRSRPGAGGGHAFAQPPAKVTIGDVVRAIEGQILDAPRIIGDASSEMWQSADTALAAHLDSISIAQLAVRQAALSAKASDAYVI